MNFGMTLASLAALLAAAIVGEAGQDGRVRCAGGQGNDEVVSEAESMRRYLTESRHVPADAVLMEDRSTTTMENLRFRRRSWMRAAACNRFPGAWPRLPLRAGHQRLPCVPSQRIRASGREGGWVGSHTRGYYWPTAFIREFIAVTKAHLWPYCALARPGIDRLPCATGLYRALGRDTPVVE